MASLTQIGFILTTPFTVAKSGEKPFSKYFGGEIIISSSQRLNREAENCIE
jgi:hypothetical protein